MRLLGLLFTGLLLLAGCGNDVPERAEREPSASEGTPSPMGDTPDAPDAPDVQPPVDGPLPDTRTGALPMPGSPCEISAGVPPPRGRAFDGTITAVGPEGATFEVNEVFRGTVADTVTVDLGPATTSGASESSPSYSVGTRLLVSALGTTAMGCGDTRYYDEETAADWRS